MCLLFMCLLLPDIEVMMITHSQSRCQFLSYNQPVEAVGLNKYSICMLTGPPLLGFVLCVQRPI